MSAHDDPTAWLETTDKTRLSLDPTTSSGRSRTLTRYSFLASASELPGAHGGRSNKYLGHGFLAFWRDQPTAPAAVAAALAGFRELQSRAGPRRGEAFQQ